MRLGLYGLPCAGKSFILKQIKCVQVIEGSSTMKGMFPEFDAVDEDRKYDIRRKFSRWLFSEEDFIMDGHYAFGDHVVFTEVDGELYDVFLYLYIEPGILRKRIQESEKNRKYAQLNIEEWQRFEIEQLRRYCHENEKDFFVLDNPSMGYFEDVKEVVEFIKAVQDGYSCVKYAKSCAASILQNELEQTRITLSDGDKTITAKDTCNVIYGYITSIFDNNFYTGYQAWRHRKNYLENYVSKHGHFSSTDILKMKLNDFVVDKLDAHSYILTSGDWGIWEKIAKRLNISCFYGSQMSADTKYFVAKFLHQAGKHIVAYGDGMNDYYMLREADEGYLVVKPDGSVSSSIRNMDLGGISIVQTRENR